MTRVLTIGTFDLIHAGHIELFVESAELGDLYVAVNTDEFVEQYKGQKPLIPILDRLIVVRHIKEVKEAIVNFGNEDARLVIKTIRPDIITIGDDWYDYGQPHPEARYHRQLGLDQKWLDANGIRIIYLQRTMGRSSRKFRSGRE